MSFDTIDTITSELRRHRTIPREQQDQAHLDRLNHSLDWLRQHWRIWAGPIRLPEDIWGDYDVLQGGSRCAWCRRLARGWADIDGDRYCHPNEGPSCYVESQTTDGQLTLTIARP
jgi:hypothetical protein